MKKVFLTLAMAIAFTTGSFAQTTQTSAPKGNWVVEGNKYHKVQTVKFYDEQQQLIYEEALTAKLNISKKKTQQALDMILENLLNQNGYLANKNIVAASFRARH